MNYFATNRDRATVIGEETGENAHQRRFAGAILSNNGMDLGRKEIKVYLIDSARRPETLDHSAHAYDGCRSFRERVFAQTVFGGIHGGPNRLQHIAGS